MEDINIIYSNSFGMAFTWEKHTKQNIFKVQLVFRNTGMLLNKVELKQFSKHIKIALKNSLKCNGCCHKNKCKSLLLETPTEQVSFAMNQKELKDIDDLINGTLFHLDFNSLLKKNTINKLND